MKIYEIKIYDYSKNIDDIINQKIEEIESVEPYLPGNGTMVYDYVSDIKIINIDSIICIYLIVHRKVQ